MNSYIKPTVNPDTHAIEQAEWLDNYFGEHNYGMRFPSTGVVYRADEYEWTDDPVLLAIRAVSCNTEFVTRSQTETGKRIETREHADGRKDVTVEVKSLDVDLSDPANAEAKKVIEEQVLPALAQRQVTVTVIHKPTNDSASFVCSVVKVREYAEKVVAQRGGDKSEYCLVQHDGESVTVTTL